MIEERVPFLLGSFSRDSFLLGLFPIEGEVFPIFSPSRGVVPLYISLPPSLRSSTTTWGGRGEVSELERSCLPFSLLEVFVEAGGTKLLTSEVVAPGEPLGDSRSLPLRFALSFFFPHLCSAAFIPASPTLCSSSSCRRKKNQRFSFVVQQLFVRSGGRGRLVYYRLFIY